MQATMEGINLTPPAPHTRSKVSMPTGSLCAERNVIGTALATNVGLRREDLKAVAVLAVSLDGEDDGEVLCEEVGEEKEEDVKGKSNLKGSGRKGEGGEEGKKMWMEKGEEKALEKGKRGKKEEGTVDDKLASPVRKVSIRKWSDESSPIPGRLRKPSATVITTHQGELNPLKPCGACNEWLKKIAEPNPGFLVITYTDVGCGGVYENLVAI